jgi:uncharacterized OB-fold protein
MSKEYRTTPNNVALPYRWALGKIWTRFFNGLKEEKILGTKCNKCGKVFVPARPFCPECLIDMQNWVEIRQEGTVTSWSLVCNKFYTQVKEPPYVQALIRLDGTDSDFFHFIGGIDLSDANNVRNKIKIGTKVKAIWRETKNADINDISYFTPVK